MSEQKTQAELRGNATHRDLFHLTENMLEAMERARVEDAARIPDTTKAEIDENHNNFRPYDQNQDFFVPIGKDGFLEENHPARIVDVVVERLDLSTLYESYSHEGNPAYHPKMMLKVLFYAYYVGIMSARTIWDCVINRADFLYLATGQVPNFRTINSFRLRHLCDLGDLFTQIVLLCAELGMIGFEHLAIDGQKIQANANFRNSKNLKGLKKEYEKTKAGLEKLLAREVNEDFPQTTKDKRTTALTKKLAKLEGFQEQLEALGDEEKRVNMSDADAPVMRHKDGTSKPSYTHQSAIDESYGVTTAVRTTQTSDRPSDLLEVVDASKENTGGSHETVTADCGFCDYDMLEKVEERSEEFYVPDKRFEAAKKKPEEKHKYDLEDFRTDEEDAYICPAGKPMEFVGMVNGAHGEQLARYLGTGCEACPLKPKCTTGKVRTLHVDSREGYRRKMREKLNTDKGREIYMKRQGLVEPVHGDDQKNRGWKQHHLRGLTKAQAEFVLVRIAANLAKIIRFKADEMMGLAVT